MRKKYSCSANGVKFKVGYDYFADQPLFYIETAEANGEQVTLHLTPIQLRALIAKITTLCETIEQHEASIGPLNPMPPAIDVGATTD